MVKVTGRCHFKGKNIFDILFSIDLLQNKTLNKNFLSKNILLL